MRFYFAYGSNLSLAAMAKRCPSAKSVGVARLPRYRFAINRHGYATVVPSVRRVVYGWLWQISPGDEKALDYYEALEEGLYRQAGVDVYRENKPNPIRALTYMAADSSPGRPLPGYLEEICAWAERLGFEKSYIMELKAWR